MLKKLFVAAAATSALIAMAVPAVAQTGGSASISGVSNGQTITGNVTVRGVATANTGANVRHLEIQINGSVVKSEDYSGIKASASLDYVWNTSGIRNGEYPVKVSAQFSGDGSDSVTYYVKVDNGASVPTGVSAALNGGNVVVTWNANPEPDITGYQVERDSGSGWTSVGKVTGTSLTDSPSPGSYNYRVTAFRYSPINGEKASAPSGSAWANVPAPSSGSTGGGGGGDGSSSGGGYYSGGDGYFDGGSGGGGNGAGSPIPGYGNNKDGKKGKGGKGSGGGNPWDLGFGSFGGFHIGGIGLPSHLSLPSSRGSLSPSAQEGIDWGTYQEELPYSLGDANGSAFPDEFLGGLGTASRYDYAVIPPDGLRWVAAGLWFLVAAALLKFLERRLAANEKPAEEQSPAPAETSPVSATTEAAQAGTKSVIEATDETEAFTVKTTGKHEAARIVETTDETEAFTVRTGSARTKLKAVKEDAA